MEDGGSTRVGMYSRLLFYLSNRYVVVFTQYAPLDTTFAAHCILLHCSQPSVLEARYSQFLPRYPRLDLQYRHYEIHDLS